MENNDLIKERILSLEDFQNVDSELMQIISQNEEYQRLFQEYKEISRLAKESAPLPQKNGISLHQAVMNRVKNGDIAPKYINTQKFRFPFATVASLCVVIAVVWLAKNGVFPQNNKNLSDINITSQKTVLQTESVADDQKITEKSLNNAYFAPKNSSQTPNESATETAEISSDTTALPAAVSEESNTFSVNPHTSSQNTNYGENSNNSHTPQTFQAFDNSNEYNNSTEPQNPQKSESPKTQNSPEIAEKEQLKLKSIPPTSNSSSVGGGSTSKSADNDEVQKIISLAKELGASEVIDSQLISTLGKQKFVEWFQSISQSQNFKELYTSENFKKYCENNQ